MSDEDPDVVVLPRAFVPSHPSLYGDQQAETRGSKFTKEQQKEHRETFIKDYRQKAWGAACHANWVGDQLDKLIED